MACHIVYGRPYCNDAKEGVGGITPPKLNLGRKYTGYAANLVPPISERFHTYHVGDCLKIDYDAIVHIRAFWG